MNITMKRGLCCGLRCFNSSSASSLLKVVNPTLLQPRVLLYDAVSHLCHRGVKWVIRADKDRKIKFCCIQSDAAEPYLRACGLEREDVLRRILFVEGLNVYSQGSTGVFFLGFLSLFVEQSHHMVEVICKSLHQ